MTVHRGLKVPTHSPSSTLLIKLPNLLKKAEVQLKIYIFIFILIYLKIYKFLFPPTPTSLVSSAICLSRVQERACPLETCPPTSRCDPDSVQGQRVKSLSLSLLSADEKRGHVSPVRCRVCRGSEAAWSLRVRGRACSPPEGSPPSGSARSEPDVPPSASSDLKFGHE